VGSWAPYKFKNTGSVFSVNLTHEEALQNLPASSTVQICMVFHLPAERAGRGEDVKGEKNTRMVYITGNMCNKTECENSLIKL
jgi:hypothetical protein